ncbi:MAG: hypothetical protein M5U28_07735 [Sandaracinaceae bacterium]|nr:hypothetical protein [Sandaracinaceae bacterium]
MGSIEELEPTLLPPLHGRRSPARPPLLLIIADWRFGHRTLLDAFPFFDAVYPLTGMLVYSGAPDVEPIVRECARRKIVWLPKPFGAAQLRTIIERVGIPRDDERIELRRLLIQLASRGKVVPEPRDMPEHLLRVAEGRVLDCLDKRRGAIAHGLEESSIAQYALDIKSRTGMSLEDLRSVFFQSRIGRGAPASPLFDDRYDASFDGRRDARPDVAGPGERDATVPPTTRVRVAPGDDPPRGAAAESGVDVENEGSNGRTTSCLRRRGAQRAHPERQRGVTAERVSAADRRRR